MIYVSIDIETTGLDPEKHQILSFGAVIEDTKLAKPIEDLPALRLLVDFDEPLEGNSTALEMNKSLIEEIRNAREVEDLKLVKKENLCLEFSKWLSRNKIPLKQGRHSYVAAGKNFATFDLRFLEKLPNFGKIKPGHKIIDPAILYTDWITDEKLPSMQECFNRASIDKIVSHDCLDDAIDVVKLCRKFYR